jgi:hypothetical protein
MRREPLMNTDGHGFYGAEKQVSRRSFRSLFGGSMLAQEEAHRRTVSSVLIRVHPWFQWHRFGYGGQSGRLGWTILRHRHPPARQAANPFSAELTADHAKYAELERRGSFC